MRSVILSFIFISAFNQAYTQFEQQTFILAGISVEGNEFVEDETIISLSGLRVGEEYNYPYDERLSKAVKRLWDRKQFAFVDIRVDRITSAGIFLVIEIQENKRLSEIVVRNVEELSNDEVKEAIARARGDVITPFDVYKAKRAIKKLYDEEGLAFAKIEIELFDTDTNQYQLMDVWVDEGVEFKIEEVVFIGNEQLEWKKLNKALGDVGKRAWYAFWKSRDFTEEKFEEAKEGLRAYFQQEGFIDAEILNDTVYYNPDQEIVKIEIEISEGEKVFVRNIDFDGNTVFTDDQLLKRLEFAEGEIYDVQRFDMNLNLNEKQTDAKSLYNNTGYLFCEFVKDVKRVSKDSVDIKVNVFENDRAQVRKVVIIGNDKTKDKVIRRELFVRPGDYFNRSAIIRSVNALNVLGYFNPEQLRPDVKPVPSDNTQVDVEFTVEEKSTDTFNASVGFAGTFGLTGAIGFSFNNFSISEPLKGGGGELFNFNWEFGQAQRFQSLAFGYTQPWLFDEPTTVGFNIFDTRYNLSGFAIPFKLRRTGISFNVGRRLKWPDDYFRVNYNLLYQRNDIDSSSANSRLYRPGQYGEFTLGQTISRASLDNMFFATTGSRFQLSTRWAMGAIGLGQTDFLKNELIFDLYNSLAKFEGKDRLVLYLGTHIGYLAGLENDSTMNPIELYTMGGSGINTFLNTIPLRGYTDGSINGTGGKFMTKYTAELRLAVSLDPMPIYVFTFAEAGNTWDDFITSNPFDLKRAAGVGIQLLLNPIGVVGFSYGYGFDRAGPSDLNVSGWQFNFNLGNRR